MINSIIHGGKKKMPHTSSYGFVKYVSTFVTTIHWTVKTKMFCGNFQIS